MQNEQKRELERGERGFTLVELMIVVGIISIIAAIAIPSYNDYVRRSQLTEAFNNLAAYRVKMEQYYQDNRSYANGANCGVAAPAAPDAKYFGYACALDTTGGAAAGQSYRLTATGVAASSVNLFVYTINERNVKATTAMAADWGSLPANAGSVWVDKKP
jgi:type IV pilus assembly protein PilE